MKKKIKFIVVLAATSAGAIIGTALTVTALGIGWNNNLFLANLGLMLVVSYLIYRRQDLTKFEYFLAALAGLCYLILAVFFDFYG